MMLELVEYSHQRTHPVLLRQRKVGLSSPSMSITRQQLDLGTRNMAGCGLEEGSKKKLT